MPGNGERWSAKRAAGGEAAATVRPGALTELLLELVRPAGAGGGSGGSGGSAPPPGGGGPGGSDPPSAPPPRGPSPGERIGRFEIVREIGRGGFGTVYEARDLELGREVAFKLVRRAGPKELKADRMLAEAEAAARLAHPNIVHLYDLGRCTYGPYLIMELLRGATLAERLGEGRLAPREALRVGVEASRGVAHAHAQGVVHRDLKPGNVFVCEDGQVKLLDFGLAQVFGRESLLGGTPAYMAPEQARGESGDERSDVYALGVMLFELLSGKLPYERERERGVPEGGTAPEIPGAPAALQKLVDRLLARNPTGRPVNGAEAHALLAAFQRSIEPRRRVWLAWALTGAAVAAAVWIWIRPHLPPGRLVTVMADAENAAGEATLSGYWDSFRAALQQSRRVALVPRRRLAAALADEAGGAAPRVIGEAETRRAAKAVQAQLLLVPAVQRGGSGYELSVRALDLERGRPLFGLRELAVGPGSVPDALGRLVVRVRRELGEDRTERPRDEKSVPELAPRNPDVLRLLREARQLENAGQEDSDKLHEARRRYLEAIAADPGYLPARIAFLDLRWSVLGNSAFDEQDRAQASALRAGLHRLPPAERARAEFLAREGDEFDGFGDAVAVLDRYIDAAPEDTWGYEKAIDIRLAMQLDLEAARPYMERWVALAPHRDSSLPDRLVQLGRLDEALALVQSWTEAPDAAAYYQNLTFVHQARGETAEALVAARRYVATPGARPGRVWEAYLHAGAMDEFRARIGAAGAGWRGAPQWRGRLLDLIGWIREKQLQPATWVAANRFSVHLRRALLYAARGDAAATRREGEAALLAAGGGPVVCVAWQLALLGDAEGARRLAGANPLDYGCARLYRAVRSWKAGDREDALARLSAIHGQAAQLHRGQILAELGRDAEAVEAFRLSRRPLYDEGYSGFLRPMNHGKSLYHEAAALERLGRLEEARRAVGLLLDLWRDGDPDLPLLAEARAMGERLGASGGE